LDVSGSVDALERPQTGPWLRNRLDEFDVIVASKLDRVGRNARHIYSLMSYLNDAEKDLRCALDSTNIKDPIGRMIVNVMATVAEMELENIRTRNSGAAQHIIDNGAYRGGTTPAGYMPVKDESGWRLVPDEDGLAPVIRDVVKRLADGERNASILADLNGRNVPTPKDRQDELAGRTPKSRFWRAANFRRLVQSPTIIGQAVHRPVIVDADGKPVLKDGAKQYGPEQVVFKDGAPLVRAEPLVSPELFYAAKAEIAARTEGKNQTRRATEAALLTGVLYCGKCEHKMYRLVRKHRKDHYRCNSTQRGQACGNGNMTCEDLDQAVTDELMGLIGAVPFARSEYVAGSDNSSTIEQIDAELMSYVESVGRFPPGSPAYNAMMAKVDALTAKRIELAGMPEIPSGWRYVPTGETFAEHWAKLSVSERNDYLRNHGFRVNLTRPKGEAPSWAVDLGDALKMLDSINPKIGQITRQWIEDRKAGKPMPKPSPEVIEANERYKRKQKL
jgi:site-specific DNA recombinase